MTPISYTTVSRKGRIGWYAAGLGVAVVLFALATFLVLQNDGRPLGWEYSLFTAINGWPDWLYRPMWAITWAAEPGILAALSVAVAFFAKAYRLAARLALTIIGAYGATYLLKDVIDRARPEEAITGFHARMHETNGAFPSGHATAITVVMLTLLPYLPRKWQWIVPIPIGLVMLSRIYLGDHMPLDVLAGFAVSLGAVCFVRLLPQSFRKALRID